MATHVTRIVFYLLILFMLCGIGIFMKGFLPLKKNSPGFSSLNASGNEVSGKFNRLIIIMIDALRADFVFNTQSYMPFTKDLIEQGKTYSFQAYCNPPTVTMPRIKAITTGTIPGFIDVILNVDSKTLQEDNMVTQMKISKRKIVFFGDDTWVKLFPDHFERSDGTSSFFVTDYTEVDNNVTRHLKPELKRNDWDVMILHYLGLDHIGHLAGPTSPLVQPKLTEMDNVIEVIYNTVLKQDEQRNDATLMMLCGDHGMSDGGSHGGSSSAETTTPLVFMSSLFYHGQGKINFNLKVNQIDITPTLSLLLGLSIPKNSIGILIPDLFSHHSPKQRLEALRMNSLQVLEVLRANTKESKVIELDMAIKFHDEWLTTYINGSTSTDSRAEKISGLYMTAMKGMTSELTKTMSSYDKYALYIGMWLLVQSFLGTLCIHFNFISDDLLRHFFLQRSTGFLVIFLATGFTAYIHVHCCSMQSLGTSELLCAFSVLSISFSSIFILSTALTLTVLVLVLVNIHTSNVHNCLHNLVYFLAEKSQTEIFLILGILLHNVSLLSTSFIEEEHQTWYFTTTTYHLILFCLVYFQCTSSGEQQGMETSENFSEAVQETNFENFSKENVEKNVLKAAYCDTKSKVYPRCQYDKRDDQNSRGEILFMLLVLLCCDRILRSWNQTGIKWADQPDVGDWLVNPGNKMILSYLVIIALAGIAAKTYMETKKRFIIFLVFMTGVLAVYVYRAVTGSVYILPWRDQSSLQKGIPFAQWVHLCVVVIVLTSIFEFLKTRYETNEENALEKGQSLLSQTSNQMAGELFLVGYLLLVLLLLRPHNIPLMALTVLQAFIHHGYIWKRCRSNLEVILSAYYIGWFTYFAQGNSNSLATVDIAAGYIGLDQNYSPVLVGVLTSLVTFSGPLFWMGNAVLFIKKNINTTLRSTSAIGEVCTTLLLIKSINLTVCVVMSWLNCYHLFVWSVFSPKLLYEGVISVVFSTFILIIFIIN